MTNDSLYCQKPVSGDDRKNQTPENRKKSVILGAIRDYHDTKKPKKRRSTKKP